MRRVPLFVRNAMMIAELVLGLDLALVLGKNI